MDILKFPTTEEFVRAAADAIAEAVTTAQAGGKVATVGLSGGSTPQPIYTLLATNQTVNWHKVRFFLVDERYMPADSNDSNQKMIRETLLTRDAADAAVLFPDTALALPECIADYGKKILKIGPPDLLILGMGDDGHIASLFPPVPPEAFGPATVIHTQTERLAVKDRISVTFPVLKDAKKRILLITGDKKSALLTKMQQTNEDVSLYPAQYLFDERTVWMVGP